MPGATDQWYGARGAIGGLDHSGTGVAQNFAPGTAFVSPVFLPNHSNRPGGFGGFPDTGAGQRIWFAGVSLMPDPIARLVPVTSGPTSGAQTVHVAQPNPATGDLDMGRAAPTLSPL